MTFVPEGLCDRSQARSAWNRATQKSRLVGYGLIRAGIRTDSILGVPNFKYDDAAHIFDEKYTLDVWDSYARSYRTLRDDSLGERFPKHFVPGVATHPMISALAASGEAVEAGGRRRRAANPIQAIAIPAAIQPISP
jgi:hypothetical protein